MIKVLLFAHLRELAQTGELNIDATLASTTKELIGVLINRYPALAPALADESAMISVNHTYAGWDAEIKSGDEVGILPPVSGG